jgi:hypothetical protein
MRYYDLKRHWMKRIEPHLGDEKLNAILTRDFNKFTFGNWNKPSTMRITSRVLSSRR